MIELIIVLCVFGVVGIDLGVVLFPKVPLPKVTLIAGAGILVIAVVLFAITYKAAHTLPKGAQLIERDVEDRSMEEKGSD